MPAILAPVSAGELIDKITILEIKSERITDAEKLAHIHHELELLEQTCRTHIADDAAVSNLRAELKKANEALWEIEDAIRLKERSTEFDDEFIRLARAVYIQNDERSMLKRSINELSGSELMEVKSYASYTKNISSNE